MQTRCSDREARAYSLRQDALFVGSTCLFVLIAFLYVFGCRQPEPQVATPTFSPDGGTFLGSVEVMISCATSVVTIHYTTDGSTPTRSHGTSYLGPIHLVDTTTVKAMAFKDGMLDSAVATATFTNAAPQT